jgi:predicted enzyme related to lactoylglutathione lyase
MVRVFVNIDVDDLDQGIDFYTRAFGFQVARRLGPTVVELAGAPSPVFLLQKPPGSAATTAGPATRDYHRHWTPVHLDFEVSDVEAALARAVAAGARAESAVTTHDWGRIAYASDPFGHGFCLLQLSARGYDAFSTDGPTPLSSP